MSRWIQDDTGDWLNLALAVRVRFEGAKAQIWFLDGQTITTHHVDELQAWLRGDPLKDNLVGAYRRDGE